MKNVPRIYLDEKLKAGATVLPPMDTVHYLTRVMRIRPGDDFLVFHNGTEFSARLNIGQTKKDPATIIIGTPTQHVDPSNSITLAFAPIKQARAEELVSMCTQMGIMRFIPVITDHTTAKHINWDRIRKIAIEAAEQSGRNSIPEVMPPVKFSEFISKNGADIIYADERAAHDGNQIAESGNRKAESEKNAPTLLVGPEGGFSDAEFDALRNARARAISLGKTILRAEVAAIAACAKILFSNQ